MPACTIPPPRYSTTMRWSRPSRRSGLRASRARARACPGSRSTRCCASRAGERNDVDAIALTRGFHPTYHLRVPLWRELRYSFERARGTGRDQRDLAVLSRRHGTCRYAEDISRRAVPARQRVPAGHGDPFREPSRGARARGAVLHRLERRAHLHVGRHRRQCQLLDAFSEGRQARVPLRRRPLADPHAEGDRARQRLRLRDSRVRLQDAAPRGQADRALRPMASRNSRRKWPRVPLQQQ